MEFEQTAIFCNLWLITLVLDFWF